MKTLRQAQQVLKAYDQRYWKHEPGGDTIQHLFIHIMQSAARNAAHDNWSWLLAFRKNLPGRLIEHALRLASDAGQDLEDWLLSAPDPGISFNAPRIERWLHIAWRGMRTKFLERASDDQLFREFIANLLPLIEAAERSGHGELPDKEKLRRAAAELLKYAILFGPFVEITDDDYWFGTNGDYRSGFQEEFLKPFADHLAELWKRRAYAHA